MSSDLANLKNCPFCGDNSVSVVFDNMSARILCSSCKAMGPEFTQRQKLEEAVVAWNKREERPAAH
jgi:Lar family restriction alleviation protein